MTTSYWECLLHAQTSSKHEQFHKIGKNSGNLMKHCEHVHSELLDGIERVIAETEASKAEAEVAEFVRKMRVPIGDLSRLFGRKDSADLSAECAVLIWFLDAQIAFNQLDNELFREFV